MRPCWRRSCPPRAAGFYVVVNTVLPRKDGGWTPAMEEQRVSYNALVRANGAGADAVNDVVADPLIGDATNPAASSYHADGVHPSRAGQEQLAVLHAAVLGRCVIPRDSMCETTIVWSTYPQGGRIRGDGLHPINAWTGPRGLIVLGKP